MSETLYSYEARPCNAPDAEGDVKSMLLRYRKVEGIERLLKHAYETGGRAVTGKQNDGKLLGIFIHSPTPNREYPEFSSETTPAYLIYALVEREERTSLRSFERILFKKFLEDLKRHGFEHFLFAARHTNLTAFNLYNHFVQRGLAQQVGASEERTFFAAAVDDMLGHLMHFASPRAQGATPKITP